jgi:hypothetical protein
MAVFKDIDRQLVQVGDDFGTSESNVGTAWYPSTNRIVHWQNDLYCVANEAIWKYDVANSGEWGVFHEFAVAGANSSASAFGLTACSIDGVPVLVTAYGRGTSIGRFVSISTSGTVTESSDKTFQGSTFDGTRLVCFSPISYRNTLTFMTRVNSMSIQIYDLKTEALTFTGTPAGIGNYTSNLCIFNDKVFWAAGNTDTRAHLWRVDGNTNTDLGFIDDAFPTHDTFSSLVGNFSLASVTGSMYAAWSLSAPPGPPSNNAPDSAAVQIFINPIDNSIASVVDRTATVPTELQYPGSLMVTDGSILGRVDNISNNGLANATYEYDVATTTAEGTQRRLYTWNGDMDTTWTFIDISLDARRYDWNIQVNGSTVERIWSGSGTLNASEPVLSISGPNILAKFKVWGASQTGVSAKVLFDKEGGLCQSPGTIASTDVGSLNGNTVEGLTADGVTEVTVAWEASLDGISTGDNPKVAIRVFI